MTTERKPRTRKREPAAVEAEAVEPEAVDTNVETIIDAPSAQKMDLYASAEAQNALHRWARPAHEDTRP